MYQTSKLWSIRFAGGVMKENAIERHAKVQAARESAKPMTLGQTIGVLEYIGCAAGPEEKDGGFNEQTIHAARSAIHHIKRLRRNKET